MNSQTMGNNIFDNAESFKGGRAGGGGGAFLAAGAAGAAGSAGLMSNSAKDTMQRCPIDDQSFYCQLSRTTNIVGMLLYLFVVIILVISFVYFAYNYFLANKSKISKK